MFFRKIIGRIFLVQFVFHLAISVYGCTSPSEKLLTEKLQNETFDFSKTERFLDNIEYAIKDDIHYGTITFEDGQMVKFWFLSRHLTSDMEEQFMSSLMGLVNFMLATIVANYNSIMFSRTFMNLNLTLKNMKERSPDLLFLKFV